MAYGACAPTAPDQLAGWPGSDRPARERSDSRLLRALPGRGYRSVARPPLHRYAASDFRGPRVSLERHRNKRERHLRVWLDQHGRRRAELGRSTFFHMLENGQEEM